MIRQAYQQQLDDPYVLVFSSASGSGNLRRLVQKVL